MTSLHRKCTEEDEKDTNRCKLEDTISNEIVRDAPSQAPTREDQTFIPLYLMSEWQEPRTTLQRLSVAIILPSGIGPGQFKLKIVDEGDCLELTVDWQTPLIDISIMHKKGLATGLSDVHPKHT